MSTSSIQKRNIAIGEVIVALFIGSLWIPSANEFPLWGNILGTALFSLLGAAWYIVNVRYPHLLAWMQDEQKVDRVMEIAVGVAIPFMIVGMDFLFWAILQHSVNHTTLLTGLAALTAGLLAWWVLGLIRPSLTENSVPVPFFVAFLLGIAVFAAWLAFPALVAGGCTVIAVIVYAAFLVWYRRWEMRRSELFDYDTPLVVRDLDEQTIAFLRTIPGVTLSIQGAHALAVSLSTPDTEWNALIEPGGRKTWLFHYAGEQVLGCDVGGGLPARLWAATAQMWNATTAFAFALARYQHELGLGVISSDTPPPDPASFEE